MDRETQLQLFRNFIENCTTVAKSVRNYSDFKRINECISSLLPDKSILDFDDPVEFESIINKLKNLSIFVKYNKQGNNQYSNTIEYYLRFLKAKKMFSKKEDSISDKKVSIFPLQQIFYGAPGTGKSHTIKEVTENQPKENVFRTTFHPDSDYSTFVGCYKPTMKPVADKYKAVAGKDEEITYDFVSQAFTNAYLRAWQTEEPVYLVIEEINRGNCAQIFGDLFQLLDRGTDGVSEYPIKPDADLGRFIAENMQTPVGNAPESVVSGDEMVLPNNLYIWATMNTSDQSLFPIDSAFKRRWDWKYVPIDINKENWTIKTATKEYSWSLFLQKINDEIYETTHSEDKKLGFYFCKADDGVISSEKFVGKVLFYVYNDVFKDYGFSREMFKGDDGKIISFHSYYNSDGSIDENLVEKFLDNLIKEENSTIPSEENVEQ